MATGSFSSLNGARWLVAAAATRKYVYALGGGLDAGGLNAVERATIGADGSLGAFLPTTSMAYTRVGAAAVTVGQNLYVLGGDDSHGAQWQNVEWAKIGLGGALAWQTSPVPDMTIPRELLAAVHVRVGTRDFIYAMGGQSGQSTFESTVERAEVLSDGSLVGWTLMQSMTTTRYGLAAAASDGYIYALGGFGLVTVERAQVLPDGSLSAWLSMESMKTPRYLTAAVAQGRSIFAIGGDNNDVHLNTIEQSYIGSDHSLGPWTILSDTMTTPRSGLAVAQAGQYAYALGGKDVGDHLLDSTEFAHIQQPHKVVVLFQGINTSLQCAPTTGQCTPGDPSAFSVQGLTKLQKTLVTSYGFSSSDILWYSYRGGAVDPSVPSGYRNNDYTLSDTSKPYDEDIKYLRNLVEGLGAANPNTEFHLVGHSQGGLVAFQELGYLLLLPQNGTTVKEIITLDSPLGGSPHDNVKWATRFSVWGNPAAAEQVAIYGSTTTPQHATQGDSAEPACSFAFGSATSVCVDSNKVRFGTNDELVAARDTTKVYTYGNTNDPVYRPGLCVPGIGRSNISSQVVTAADSGSAGLQTLPFTFRFSPARCASENHGLIVKDRSASIAQQIGSQN